MPRQTLHEVLGLDVLPPYTRAGPRRFAENIVMGILHSTLCRHLPGIRHLPGVIFVAHTITLASSGDGTALIVTVRSIMSRWHTFVHQGRRSTGFYLDVLPLSARTGPRRYTKKVALGTLHIYIVGKHLTPGVRIVVHGICLAKIGAFIKTKEA